MLVLAVMGTSVSIGPNGFSMTASLLNRTPETPARSVAVPISTDEVQAIVNSMIADSERHQSETLRSQLDGLESQLKNAHEADLVKVSARFQQTRELIKTLERDIDRREGLAPTDILFSEALPRSGASRGSE